MSLKKLLDQCLRTETPFIHNEYSYVRATPHHHGSVILVRTTQITEEMLKCVDGRSSADFKCITDFFKKVETEFCGGGFMKLAELAELAELNIRKCLGCRGSKIQGICYECNGVGKLNFMTEHHEYNVMCKTCNGSKTTTDQSGGVTTCDHCGGSGNWYLNARQPVSLTSENGVAFEMSLSFWRKTSPFMGRM
ncbi:hypothetical protein [Photobacterium kishitanii]|uniref:CR-type domain-containing protein n=1 Tax=Photobacterium kishitanii TaxID=318456 RepID=A0A2T3KLJ3_9GAMM|nr:hypothetical protein [Photobacterium kishitanii]PSV00546.1 hypothetical protein C9J27_05270 [Photobacterium kishitanii]